MAILTGRTEYWWKAIEAAKKRGRFKPADAFRAGSWVTCACGKQDPRIPRYRHSTIDRRGVLHLEGEPTDRKLSVLGFAFSQAVHDDLPQRAERILQQIEQRSACLLKKLDTQRLRIRNNKPKERKRSCRR